MLKLILILFLLIPISWFTMFIVHLIKAHKHNVIAARENERRKYEEYQKQKSLAKVASFEESSLNKELQQKVAKTRKYEEGRCYKCNTSISSNKSNKSSNDGFYEMVSHQSNTFSGGGGFGYGWD